MLEILLKNVIVYQKKTTSDDRTRGFDKDLVAVNTSEGTFQRSNFNDRTSESTDIDVDEFSLVSDPIFETQEGGEQVYKQQVYFCQYQPPTPEPINIEIQEIDLKSQVQRPSIHVHVQPNQYIDEQRTPSPTVIKGVPSQLPSTRPVVVEQCLSNKPTSKRITYRHANHNLFIENETNRQHNRYIKYKVPRTIVQFEITRLPVITSNPKEYKNKSNQLARSDTFRTLSRDLDMFQWRI